MVWGMVPSAANPPGFALGPPVASTGGGGVERICPNRADRKIDEVPLSYFVDPAVHNLGPGSQGVARQPAQVAPGFYV